MKNCSLVATALLAFGIIASTPAVAVPLQYTLSGTDLDGTIEFASFRIDSTPPVLPNNIGLGEGFRLKFIQGTFRYGAQLSNLQDVQFFSADAGGGFINLDPADKTGTSSFLSLLGPQLYSGTEAAPTLLTGNFTLFDAFSNAPISLSVAAVPEPATWAMLVVGFGIAGLSKRSRRVSVIVGASSPTRPRCELKRARAVGGARLGSRDKVR